MPYGLGGDSHGKPKGFFLFFCFFLHPRSVLGACYHRLACLFLSVTKQETESACGGNEAIKFYEGLKLQSAFVSRRNSAVSKKPQGGKQQHA